MKIKWGVATVYTRWQDKTVGGENVFVSFLSLSEVHLWVTGQSQGNFMILQAKSLSEVLAQMELNIHIIKWAILYDVSVIGTDSTEMIFDSLSQFPSSHRWCHAEEWSCYLIKSIFPISFPLVPPPCSRPSHCSYQNKTPISQTTLNKLKPDFLPALKQPTGFYNETTSNFGQTWFSLDLNSHYDNIHRFLSLPSKEPLVRFAESYVTCLTLKTKVLLYVSKL